MGSSERAARLPAAMRERHAQWASDGLVATARVIADELRRRGIAPEPLLREHDLHTAPLWSPFSRASRGAILCFVEDCLAAAGDPALHVLATATAEIGAFHMADYLGLMAPTFGAGCRAIMERFQLVNGGCAFAIDEQPEEISARFFSVYEPQTHPLEAECTFVAIDGRMRVATGGRYGVLRVDFAHAESAASERLEATLGCPVRYGQGSNRLAFARAAWRFRPRFFNAAGRAIVEAAVAPFQLALGDEDLIRAARNAVAESLSRGSANLEAIARRLGMSYRSLQRRLAEKGTSFSEMIDQERRGLALRRMAEPGARASQVGYGLGFAEASAFTRAFKRWTGMSPTEYAARQKPPGDAP
jgi:AraC-like DNA-binding protein